MSHASKVELANKSWTTPGVLAKAGCPVSIITDSSVIQQENLPLCAGMAVRAGMDPFQALQAITIRPAQHIGAADRVGSIEVGKDADLVIANGSPMAIATRILRVMIDGKNGASAVNSAAIKFTSGESCGILYVLSFDFLKNWKVIGYHWR